LVNFKRIAPLFPLVCLILAACSTGSIPVEALATELAASHSTPTSAPTATSTATPTATATPLPSLSVDDPTGDCVTAAFLPIDCSVLQREVTGVELESDGETLTVTVTIEGGPWGQPPDHFATFQFDTDMDSTTGSLTLGIAHGMGTDTNIYWGWTPTSLPFGGEHYDELGSLVDSFGERDELFTIVDDQTLQLEVPIEDIGSDTFNFVFSLEAPPSVGIFDFVPEPGETLSFPSGG
jgi:hypothetical protein